MPDSLLAYSSILLDTSAPSGAVVIGSAAARVNAAEQTIHITTTNTDVIQYKVWGDVDAAFDTEVQPLEADSTWKSFATEALTQDLAIRLAAGDGSKTIYVKIRDDVLNESPSFNAVVFLDNTLPTVAITAGPTPKKISKIATKNSSELSFQSSEDFMEYKVCVVAAESNTHDVGVVIGTANSSKNTSGVATDVSKAYPAATPIDVIITGADLEAASPGDGQKIIKIFVKDVAGNWSL